MLATTKQLREKYKKRVRKRGGTEFWIHPPGGEDVMRLCNLADRLELIIRHVQRQSPVELQNEIESMLVFEK